MHEHHPNATSRPLSINLAIYGKDSADEMTKEIVVVHIHGMYTCTTVPLQLMMTDEGALGREIQQSTIIISCIQDNVLYCLSHEVLSDCKNTKCYITI